MPSTSRALIGGELFWRQGEGNGEPQLACSAYPIRALRGGEPANDSKREDGSPLASSADKCTGGGEELTDEAT